MPMPLPPLLETGADAGIGTVMLMAKAMMTVMMAAERLSHQLMDVLS